MIKSDKLVEATILALQGKLELKENKHRKVEARNLTAKQKNMIKQFVKDENAGKDVQWHKLITELEKVNDYETLNQDARRFKEDCEFECVDENKAVKTESIDVNVNDTTTVSVEGNETIVDTEDATVVVNKKEDEFIPETSDDLPAEVPETTVDATVAPDTDTVEVPVDDTVMPEDITDEPVDTELPTENTLGESKKFKSKKLEALSEAEIEDMYNEYLKDELEKRYNEYCYEHEDEDDIMEFYEWLDEYGDMETEEIEDKFYNNLPDDLDESKKLESVEIEVSDDGKEVEVTTDNGEEVEVKDETPDNNEEENEDTETEVPEDEPSIDEMVEENKKVTEDINESNARKAAIELNQKDRDMGEETATMTGMIATRIADIAEELGDDYSEWLDTDDVREMADEIVTSKMWTEFNNQLDDFIREIIEEKVDWIRKDEPASKYYDGNPELDESKKVDVEEGKQAEKNKEDILKNKKARFIKTTENTRSKRVQEMKANRKSNALEKLQRNVEQHKKVMEAKKLQERKYSESTWYEYEVEGVKYNFLCRTWETSQSWGHEVELKEGYRTIATARCRYYNRTWEKFTFQSCMIKAIDEAIKSGADEAKMNELRSQVEKGKGLQESKKVETKNDLGINEGTPKKEEPVPNTSTKIEEKFSSKSFSKALTEFYSMHMKTVESVNVNRLAKTSKGLKIEATLISKSGKAKQTVCLEMKKIQTGKSFDKYEMINTVGLIKENKASDTKITMTTFTNKHNVIECRYILCK